MSLLSSRHFMIEEAEKHLALQNLGGSRGLFDLQLASNGIQRALQQRQGAPACSRHRAPVNLPSLPASLLCSPAGIPAGPPTLQTPAASGPAPLLASAWGKGVPSRFPFFPSFLPAFSQIFLSLWSLLLWAAHLKSQIPTTDCCPRLTVFVSEAHTSPFDTVFLFIIM